MKMSPLWISCLASLGAAISIHAGPLKESYRLEERGIAREYVIAKDEIHSGRKARQIDARANADAVRAAAKAEPEGELVLYPKDGPRDASTRRLLTKKIAVKIAPGTDAAAIANAAGVRPSGKVRGGWTIFEAEGEPGAALEAAEKLKRTRGVEAVEVQLARQQQKRFVPNDPFFSRQWHLRNFGQNRGAAGVDVNITGVWDSFRGNGITLAIVDDGLERTHPDLFPNYDADNSSDFNDDDSDPAPARFDSNDHGTSCAGVAAARGNNVTGVCGAAFEARLAGIRLIAEPTTDLDESRAFAFHNDTIDIKSNSWGPFDSGRILEGPGPMTVDSIRDAVANGRGGNGTIVVWAGGNGRRAKDDSNFDGYANMRETLAIGAVTNKGGQAFYSETGANLVAVAPSDGGTLAVTTVDRAGTDGYNSGRQRRDLPNADYTNTFGGTSSATPLAAGVIALMLEANPGLGWRDVQEILIRTARRIDPADGGWITNGGGFHFNHRYGAGLIDAAAAVALAQTWTNLDPPDSAMREVSTPGAIIPDQRKKTSVVQVFHFNESGLRVEHAVVTVDIRHRKRGQLEIEIESPNGTKSVLAPVRPRDKGANFQWSFMTTHNWGELAAGDWRVRITDKKRGTTGTVNSIRVELFGSSPFRPLVAEGATLTDDPNGNEFYETGETVTVRLAVRNVSDSELNSVTGELVEAGGVAMPGGPKVFGSMSPGESVSKSFTFTVGAARGADVVARLKLADGGTDLGEATFTLPVGILGSETFSANLTVPVGVPGRGSSGNASVYPSSIVVNSLPPGSVVRKVKVHLDGIAHERSGDLDVLLAKAAGREKVLLLSDAGDFGLFGVDLTFDDDAAPIPASVPIATGVYRPTNEGKKIDRFSKPAPGKPFDGFLAGFRAAQANDIWQLYVRDDKTGRKGRFTNWSVEIDYAQ